MHRSVLEKHARARGYRPRPVTMDEHSERKEALGPPVERTVRPVCSQCGFPLDEYTAGLRHFGTHTAHVEWYCTQRMRAQIEQLTAALKKANDQAERFERGWYLRGDVLERLQQWADAYPVEVFPEVLRQDWQRANEVLAQAGLSMTRMSASNMRHVISGVRKLVDEGLKAQRGS